LLGKRGKKRWKWKSLHPMLKKTERLSPSDKGGAIEEGRVKRAAKELLPGNDTL